MATFPPDFGALVQRTQAAPAAGADTTHLGPATVRWRIRNVSFTFTTDATVGNRRVILFLSTSTGSQIMCPSSILQTASQTIVYRFVAGMSVPAIQTLVYIVLPMPDNVILDGQATINTVNEGMVAGDQIGIMNIFTEEWIRP